MLRHPISIYINWAAYDELSDQVELTEALAMRQLDELLRLRKHGVRFDYYVMDAFWYARDGAYRIWRKPHWPNGPDRWLAKCLEHDVKPGLWVASNTLARMNCPPTWRGSFDPSGGFDGGLCCFYGGFLADFVAMLSEWAERGVRLFKFDFANFDAAPAPLRAVMLPSEIRAANIMAFSGALKAFRAAYPDVVLLAYNGFEEVHSQAQTDLPPRKVIDARWLDVFDAIYCGDPRPADVPAMNFWRSKDIYSDHMGRLYEFNGLPLQRIDSSGFMIGSTGTCYYRRTAAWQGMLLLSLARGGWANTYYGNLDLLDAEAADWFARAQALYLPLQQRGQVWTFGGWPGSAEPYGFGMADGADILLTVVNPSQTTASVSLPAARDDDLAILFHDAGYRPTLYGGTLTLGAEQMAVIGGGRCANEWLGVQNDVIIPSTIQPIEAVFVADGDQAIEATITPPTYGTIRVLLRQSDTEGRAKRTSGGAPPQGAALDTLLTIEAWQDDHAFVVNVNYDKAIWSGLSWAVGEIAAGKLRPGVPIRIRCVTTESAPVTLRGELYHVLYP